MARNPRPVKWMQLILTLVLDDGKRVAKVQYVPVRVLQRYSDEQSMIQYIDPEKGDYTHKKILNKELYDQPL